jgi:hypothetical protein
MRCKTELAAIARSMHSDIKIAITIILFVSMIAFMECIVVDFQLDYTKTVLASTFSPPLEGGARNYTFGPITSIQNDEKGNPHWILSGTWKTNLLNFANRSQTPVSANISQQEGSSAEVGAVPIFNAAFRMITLNGTDDGHTHTITNFVLANASMSDNMTSVFNGMSTASLREGPISEIPTTIEILNGKVMNISSILPKLIITTEILQSME